MNERYICRSCNEEIEAGAGKEAPDCPNCGEKTVQMAPESHGPAKQHPGKIVLFSIVAILVIGGILFFQSRKKHPAPNNPAATVAALLEDARSLNKKTPFMIDKSTRLEEIIVDGKKITYKNTLVNLTAEDRARDDVFKKDFRVFLAEKYCNDKKGRTGLDAGITYGHEYSGLDGTFLFKADISLKDCPQ